VTELLPRVEDVPDACIDELRQLNGAIAIGTQNAPSFATAEGLAQLRAEGGIWAGVTVAEAIDRELPGPAGPIPARLLVPHEVQGILLFLHGGGWCIGRASDDEAGLLDLATRARVAVVSIDYRLAPEHPFPAGPDDCEAAAMWLLEHGTTELGTDRLVIGGGSAGGHLSVLTLLRLRDHHDALGSVVAANLVAGAFDLGMTPSQRASRDALIIPLTTLEACYANFLPGRDREARRDPAVSPLYADLTGMPPALFTVGTLDPLLDDSLFLASRWRTAGSHAELAIYPEAVHGFVAFPTEMARRARERMATFLAAQLAP
jgi:acetyl esterase/lipase